MVAVVVGVPEIVCVGVGEVVAITDELRDDVSVPDSVRVPVRVSVTVDV